MIYNWSTFKTACIAEICSQILVLPYVGQELNMVILLPFESTDLITVSRQLCPRGPGSNLDPCRALGSGNLCAAGRPLRAHRARSVGRSGRSQRQH